MTIGSVGVVFNICLVWKLKANIKITDTLGCRVAPVGTDIEAMRSF